MASTQKRWLTAPKGKLSKVDLPNILRNEEAWAMLSAETRQQLYDLLPRPQDGEAPYDIDVHPLNTSLRPHIVNALNEWQRDLVDGKEVKAWREQAMEAGRERQEGKWDDWKQQQRDEEWGVSDENAKPKANGKLIKGEDVDMADAKKDAAR